MLATVRPDDWNLVLVFHLLGALALMGGLLIVALVSPKASGSPSLQRFVLLVIAVLTWPGLILATLLGHTLESDEGTKGTWLDVAAPLSEIAGVVGLVALTVLAWLGLRKAREGTDWRPARLIPVVAVILFAVYVGVLFLMTAKPS